MSTDVSTDKSKESSHPLRHPLIVLLVGTLLGSILIPWGTARLADQKATREAQQNLVTRVLDYDTATRQALLSLHTRLNVFDENMRAIAPSEPMLRSEQGKLYEAAVNQYLVFDNGVWTTPQQILNELRVRELVPESTITAIQRNFAQYHSHVWMARDAIYELWLACVNTKYVPGDPSILELHSNANTQRKNLEEKGAALLIDAAKKIR